MTDQYIFSVYDRQDAEQHELPEITDIWFDHAVSFSNAILEKRSDDEIAAVMRSIDENIAGGAYKFPLDNLYFQREQPKSVDELGPPAGRGGTNMLLRLMRAGEKIPFTGMANPTWAEIFAVYTLGQVAYAYRDLNYLSEQKGYDDSEWINEIWTNYLVVIIELATIAQMLYRGAGSEQWMTILEKHQAERRSALARRGGRAKADKYAPLKREVIERYNIRYSSKSAQYAARKIWEELPDSSKADPNGQPLISEYSAEGTLAKWILDFKRSRKT